MRASLKVVSNGVRIKYEIFLWVPGNWSLLRMTFYRQYACPHWFRRHSSLLLKRRHANSGLRFFWCLSPFSIIAQSTFAFIIFFAPVFKCYRSWPLFILKPRFFIHGTTFVDKSCQATQYGSSSSGCLHLSFEVTDFSAYPVVSHTTVTIFSKPSLFDKMDSFTGFEENVLLRRDPYLFLGWM